MRSNKGVETSTNKAHAIEAYGCVLPQVLRRGFRSLFPIAAALVIFGCATTSAQNAVPPNIANAVANQNRPGEDRQRDADRKPEEVLTFVFPVRIIVLANSDNVIDSTFHERRRENY